MTRTMTREDKPLTADTVRTNDGPRTSDGSRCPRRSPLAYVWAAPTTALALPAVLLAYLTGGELGRRDGVLYAHGGALRPILLRLPVSAQALALGHVVLAINALALAASWRHELRHTRQTERWGIFFLPAYLAAGCWTYLRGRRFYYDNPFEIDARRIT